MSDKGYSYKSSGTNSQVSIPSCTTMFFFSCRSWPFLMTFAAGQSLLRSGLWQRCLELELVPLQQHVCPPPTQSPRLMCLHDANKHTSNGSYYYSNPNGSTYYNSGSGSSTYTSPSGAKYSSSSGSSGNSGSSK